MEDFTNYKLGFLKILPPVSDLPKWNGFIIICAYFETMHSHWKQDTVHHSDSCHSYHVVYSILLYHVYYVTCRVSTHSRGLVIAMVVSLIFIFLLRFLAGFMVWVIIVLVILVIGYGEIPTLKRGIELSLFCFCWLVKFLEICLGIFHCYMEYDSLKSRPGSNVTIRDLGLQLDFSVYLQIRQTWLAFSKRTLTFIL